MLARHQSVDPPSMHGFLHPPLLHSNKKWVVLRDGVLHIYTSPSQDKLEGLLKLFGCVCRPLSHSKLGFEIEIRNKESKKVDRIELFGENDLVVKTWVFNIQQTSVYQHHHQHLNAVDDNDSKKHTKCNSNTSSSSSSSSGSSSSSSSSSSSVLAVKRATSC